MILIKNTVTDPYFNLASEEYMLEVSRGDVFMLWRNDRAVVIGKNQNAYAEVNIPYVQKNGIKVVRRLTGGGAVFHDPGNVNFTFITDAAEGAEIDFSRFAEPVIAALKKMGVDAYLDGRNDILAEGFKISGNAQCVYNTADGRARLMHHGTLLLLADMASLAGALNIRSDKLRSKGIKSVRSRVANIADLDSYAGPRDAEAFMDALMDGVAGENCACRELTAEEKKSVEALRDKKYSRWEWNFGASPSYSMEQRSRFPYGEVEVMLSAKGGIIEALDIRGDFFGVKDIKELCAALSGERLEKERLEAAVKNIGEYISGATAGDIVSLILNGETD